MEFNVKIHCETTVKLVYHEMPWKKNFTVYPSLKWVNPTATNMQNLYYVWESSKTIVEIKELYEILKDMYLWK